MRHYVPRLRIQAGATAIQPGIHRITLRHQSRDLNNIFPHPTKQYAGPPPISPSAEFLSLFDQDGSPFPHVWEPLFDIFLKHFVQFFPSISKQRMIDRIESGTMSRFLSVCICAMTARHAEAAVDGPIRFCEPFIAKAQEVGTPLLQLPATDTCTALMFLSWAYYGQGSDSGIWQYAGMAIRMGVDIGIHEVSEIYVSPAHLVRTRLLWWSLYITDRIVSFSTGRPTSIADETIELPFPEDTDFFPDPARDTATDSIEPIEPVPFVYLTRLMVLVGRISNILNVRRGSTFHLANPNQPPAYDLKELQANVMTFLRELPKSLQWSIDNLRHQKERGHGVSSRQTRDGMTHLLIGSERVSYNARLGSRSIDLSESHGRVTVLSSFKYVRSAGPQPQPGHCDRAADLRIHFSRRCRLANDICAWRHCGGFHGTEADDADRDSVCCAASLHCRVHQALFLPLQAYITGCRSHGRLALLSR